MNASDRAWKDYLESIDAARTKALSWKLAQSPEMRTQGMYYVSLMQAFGFNTYMGPRTAFPTFFSHLMFTPVEYSWGAPSPDFRYHWTRIDGSRSYRIWGRRGRTPWLHIQAQKGWWGDADQRNLGAWDVDQFQLEPDGRFEIIASPDEQPGNWMKLDRSVPNVCLLVRDIWDQWAGMEGAAIYIEPLDERPDDTLILTEEEIATRLRGIAYQTHFSLDTWMRMTEEVVDAVGYNRFWMPSEDTTKIGGNPLAGYVKCLYDLQPDEALFIECEIPNVKYWSLQLADYFYQTIDYRFHPTSINNHQARLDADGKVRIVLSPQDPGVPNWVATGGFNKAFGQWRWYLSDRFPVPEAKVVKVADVRRHLPADTPVVTPERRRAEIRSRRREIGRRFGVSD